MKLAKAIMKARHVYLCGNGGSAANAIHMANDLVACGVKAHALTADVATLTANANDYSYGAAFAVQLRVLVEPGDLVLVLSGSGNSPNILQAIQAAKEKGAESWAIVGAYQDTAAEHIADHVTKFGRDMQEAEEKQIYLGHRVMRYLKSGG